MNKEKEEGSEEEKRVNREGKERGAGRIDGVKEREERNEKGKEGEEKMKREARRGRAGRER